MNHVSLCLPHHGPCTRAAHRGRTLRHTAPGGHGTGSPSSGVSGSGIVRATIPGMLDHTKPATEAAPARVLVVDDEPLTARTLVRMVTHFGHEAVVADSVEQAVARFSEASFDVVLTDLNLGGWSGFELLTHVSSRAPEVPVVLITGYATIDSAMEAIQAGAYDSIAKPPTLEGLGELLRRAIEKRRTADAALPPVREERAEDEGFHNIVGRSPQMLEI